MIGLIARWGENTLLIAIAVLTYEVLIVTR
jgi:hypothetical protein